MFSKLLKINYIIKNAKIMGAFDYVEGIVVFPFFKPIAYSW